MDCVAAGMSSIYAECAGSEEGEDAELSQQIVATNRSEVFVFFGFFVLTEAAESPSSVLSKLATRLQQSGLEHT